jgi:hypothetical protein
MAGRKRKGARVGAKVGSWTAPKAGRVGGKAAWRVGKAQAKLARRAMSSEEPAGLRFAKYGFFALAGLAIGTLIGRSGRDGSVSDTSFPGATGSAAAGHQRPEDANRTGSERDYSDPSTGPLIGEQRRGHVEGVSEQHEEVEQRIRTGIGEDPRTMHLPRVNVEVNDGVAELRGEAPSEESKAAAGEIAAQAEGVREVRNLITVNPESATRGG